MNSVLYPALLGIVTKLYDDIIDMKFDVSPVLIESLKSTFIALMIFTIHGDFYFAFCFFIGLLFTAGSDDIFWKSILPVGFLLLFISFSTAGEDILHNILLCIVVLTFIIIYTHVDEKIFPEEISHEKIITRIGISLLLMISLVVPYQEWSFIPAFSHNMIHKSTIAVLSYMLTSVCSMTYGLFHPTKK